MVKESLTDKAMFELRIQGSKGARHEDIWGKNGPNKRNSKCKDPETGVSMVSLRDSKKASVSGTE